MGREIRQPSPANRLLLDYRAEAGKFKTFSETLIDSHCHLLGSQAIPIYREAAALYGFKTAISMTPLEQVPSVHNLMGPHVRFIAVPEFHGSDPLRDHGRGYIERIRKFHALGARVAKFWSAPRIFNFLPGNFAEHPLRLDSPARLEAMQAAVDLGMTLMVHVADPDTWFKTKYCDSAKYGTKTEHYEPLETVLERFRVPTWAAHMAGWPEDLTFVSGLLERHPNLFLDTSATKWMVRELSGHSRPALLQFFSRFKGRIMFGTDIVTSDAHLSQHETSENESKASSHEEAFDLYASRFWALRTLFETGYLGESPIADPDLAMVAPANHTAMDAPLLAGKSLPDDLLESLYFGAARSLLLDRE